jgi:uncharacterized protein (TIGR02246 family)
VLCPAHGHEDERFVARVRLSSGSAARDSSLSFADAINSGDLDAALDHWMADAVLVAPDGHEARGSDEILQRLAALIVSGTKLQIEVESMAETTQMAVGATRMVMTIPGRSDQPLEFRATVVYTQRRDGWRFAIVAAQLSRLPSRRPVNSRSPSLTLPTSAHYMAKVSSSRRSQYRASRRRNARPCRRLG